MVLKKMLATAAMVLAGLSQTALAETIEIRIYTWKNQALCGEFSAETGDWIRQVEMTKCGGSEFKLYTWRGHRLCGEFTINTGEWIAQSDVENCGGKYYKTYSVDGSSQCGAFASRDDQWISDVNKWNCEPGGSVSYGGYECESGQTICPPPEVGGSCSCQ